MYFSVFFPKILKCFKNSFKLLKNVFFSQNLIEKEETIFRANIQICSELKVNGQILFLTYFIEKNVHKFTLKNRRTL